jgi:hypothetical protein
MPDEHYLTLHQADQARCDFAAIEDELVFINANSLDYRRGWRWPA